MAGRSIVITSGKGGVGKTTATANIGAALALKDKKVLVVDADIGLRNLDVILGLENRIVYTVVDVAKGLCKPQQATIKSRKSHNLYLLPASQTDDKDAITSEEFKDIISRYKKEFHFILIDSPAGIEQGFRNACSGADEALVVTTPEVSAIRDADRVVGLLSVDGIEARLVINRVDKDMVRKGDMLSPQDVVDILGIEQIGLIERDNDIVISANTGEPVAYDRSSRVGKSFIRIADRVAGVEVSREDLSLDVGFWAKIGRKFISANA